MAWSAIRTALLAASLSVLLAGGAQADDNLKIAIGQRGGWEQSVSELGQNKGFFKKHGLTLELLYTQGSAETLQSVISNSVDIGHRARHPRLPRRVSQGRAAARRRRLVHQRRRAVLLRRGQFPVKSIKEAEGKSIAISTNGSASNMFALHLARHFGVNLKPQPAGNYTATLTQVLTKQLDIGFSAAPFNLNFVDEGRIRIIARGSDVPALRDMTSRLLVVNVAGLERRKDVLKRYMAAYRETLDWMYADPGGDRRLCGMVEAAEGDRREGAGIHDPAEHGAAADFGPARDHGRRGEVQIHPGAAVGGADQRGAAGRRAEVALDSPPSWVVRPPKDGAAVPRILGPLVRMRAERGLCLAMLLRLDLGGLDQLAAHGDAVADGFGQLRRRSRHHGETDRGEPLLHRIDLEHLDELVVQPRDDRRGVPAGAKKPSHDDISKPGMVSPTVGTSGRPA